LENNPHFFSKLQHSCKKFNRWKKRHKNLEIKKKNFKIWKNYNLVKMDFFYFQKNRQFLEIYDFEDPKLGYEIIEEFRENI